MDRGGMHTTGPASSGFERGAVRGTRSAQGSFGRGLVDAPEGCGGPCSESKGKRTQATISKRVRSERKLDATLWGAASA